VEINRKYGGSTSKEINLEVEEEFKNGCLEPVTLWAYAKQGNIAQLESSKARLDKYSLPVAVESLFRNRKESKALALLQELAQRQVRELEREAATGNALEKEELTDARIIAAAVTGNTDEAKKLLLENKNDVEKRGHSLPIFLGVLFDAGKKSEAAEVINSLEKTSSGFLLGAFEMGRLLLGITGIPDYDTPIL